MRHIVLSAVALLVTASLALGAPAFDKVMPEKTLGVLRAKNLPELQAKFKAQPGYALWNEPSVQKFLEKPLARLNEELAKAEGKAGVKLEDVMGILRGEVAVYVAADEALTGPEVILLVDVGDQGPKAMEILGALVDAIGKADPNAAEVPAVVEQMIDGVKFMTVRAAGADAAAEPKLCYGVVNDVLVVGGPLAAVTRQVGFLKAPPANALANNPLYLAAMAKAPAGSDIQAFVNVAEILAVVQMKAQDPAKTAQIISALGANGLTGAALGIELGKEYNTSTMYLGSRGTPQGIVKILMPQAGPLHTGAEVPADVSSFASARLDPAAIYDEVERMLNSIEPTIMAAFNEKMNQATQTLGQPFSLRNDVLAIFGPRVGSYARAEKPYNVPENTQQVFMVDITSKAAVQALLEKLQKMAPEFFALFQPHDYMGYQVYVMTTPQAPEGQMPPMAMMPKPAFVVTEKELLIAMNPASLEAHLRRLNAGGPTLQERPEFQELLKLLPAEGRVFVSFGDARQPVESFMTGLKEGQFDMILNMFKQRDPDVAEVVDLFDFTLLPDPEVVTKYINPAATVGIVQPDGVMLVSKSSSRMPAGAPK